MNTRDVSVKYAKFAAIVVLVVLLDQITKMMVLRMIPEYQRIVVIPGFFNLTHVHNPGGAFGFLAQNSGVWRHWLFLGAAFFALGVILYCYHHTPKTLPWLAGSLAMIFGGAVGNTIDRIRFGEVVDFLDVYIASYHWPTFNVADSAVSVGIGIFILHILLKKMPF
ncbi:MAG: signal peptidase II [Desulfobacteraceae bacterium]|jgi:signal peptidase II